MAAYRFDRGPIKQWEIGEPFPRELREGADPCEACGTPIASSETRAHLETGCGGALWKKRQLLERSAP